MEHMLKRLISVLAGPESTPNLSLKKTEGMTMVCFSCGRSGHGVSRCLQIDASFPFLLPGWSIELRDGQYMAVWPKKTPGQFQ